MAEPAAGNTHTRGRGSLRRALAILLAASLGFFGAAAQAETFVLVYVEGSVVAVPGGATLSKGQQIDGGRLVQLGAADKAIFISQSGNVVRHNGPFCGIVAQSQDSDGGAPQSAGCQK